MNKWRAAVVRVSTLVLGLVLIVAFGVGIFGGPTQLDAGAQIDLGPPCDLLPFSMDGDGTPTCPKDPAPNATSRCQASDAYFGEQPFEIVLGGDEPVPTCYNLAAVQCLAGEQVLIDVIGTIVNPPLGTLDGVLEESSGVSSNVLLDISEVLAYNNDRVVLFGGGINSDPNEDIFVELYGQLAGSFPVPNELPPPCNEAHPTTFTTEIECSAVQASVGGEFFLTSEDIVLTLSPNDGRADMVIPHNGDNFFSGDGGWSYNEAFTDLRVGTYTLTATVAGFVGEGEPFNRSFGPETVSVENCVDISFECLASSAILTATLTDNAPALEDGQELSLIHI